MASANSLATCFLARSGMLYYAGAFSNVQSMKRHSPVWPSLVVPLRHRDIPPGRGLVGAAKQQLTDDLYNLVERDPRLKREEIEEERRRLSVDPTFVDVELEEYKEPMWSRDFVRTSNMPTADKISAQRALLRQAAGCSNLGDAATYSALQQLQQSIKSLAPQQLANGNYPGIDGMHAFRGDFGARFIDIVLTDSHAWAVTVDGSVYGCGRRDLGVQGFDP